MKIENQSPVDLLSALSSGGNMGGENAKVFQKLLSKVMKGAEAIGGAKNDKPSSKQELPDDAVLSAAAQITQAPQGVEQQGGESAEQEVAVTPVVTGQAAVQQITPEAMEELLRVLVEEGDILSVETNVTPAETELPTGAQTSFLSFVEESDRLGEMMGQAQQELEELTGTGEEEPESPEIPLTDEGEGSKAKVYTEPETPKFEQRQMNELPENDRAVMKMRDSRPTEERKTETPVEAAVEAKAEPVRSETAKPVQEPQPQRPAGADQMEQIRVEVTRNLEQQRMEFRMQLQPEELGKVDVKMILEHGRLAVEIMAASPKAAELLTRQAESLMLNLRLQDYDVQSVNVVSGAQSAESHMHGEFNMWGGETGENQSGSGKGGLSKGGAGADADTAQEENRSPESLMDYAI